MIVLTDSVMDCCLPAVYSLVNAVSIELYDKQVSSTYISLPDRSA